MPETTWNLSAQYPVLLLPVRLETRFTESQLLVRIYPDELHIDSHEPPLTADEDLWGRHYWTSVWAARGDEPDEHAAWDALAERYGHERAAWIARVLEPLNPGERGLPDPRPRFPVLGAPRSAPGPCAPWPAPCRPGGPSPAFRSTRRRCRYGSPRRPTSPCR